MWTAPPSLPRFFSKATRARFCPETQALFAARVDARTTARVGVPLELAVNPARLHFFDSQTGANLLREPDSRREPEQELAATQ